ncbi:unnamed protein product [Clavelina lepadiformis]|uniref:Integrator complex subunit 7 n=1 Tax=Clavelina lepadiformis TaxID=159417 RepID=A0ABP0FDK7_CLALP
MDEHQQDANSALMELDKGLRTHKVGEQCEAIVRFPSLFARFPFPILINSAFLKLADAFRTGNNFTRICIMRVAQQSTKHLDKILNIDEFMKRIYTVIHSNDPYARAITLRMLGSVACIIGEKKNAHHSIQQGLDSHDRVEQDAAIFATIQFASYSREFASSICNKISAMLQGLSTPLEIKLKLIPVMQHMHYTVQISTKARKILQDLLPSYPAQDFVLTTLNVLTQLALHSFIDIPSQVELLLQYLRCDPREAVKMDSLRNLNILAKSAPHLWTNQDSSALCKAFQLSTLSVSLKRGIIRVLCTLSESGYLVEISIEEGEPLLNLCRQCCYDLDVIQAALATKLLASVARHATRNKMPHHEDLCNEVLNAMEALLFILAPSSEKSKVDRRALKMILPSFRLVCAFSKSADVRLIKAMISLLVSTNDRISLPSETSQILLETIAGIASMSHSSSLLSNYSSKFLSLIKSLLKRELVGSEAETQQAVATLLCVLLFLSNQERGQSSQQNQLVDLVQLSCLNHWTVYRIARQASRMGQHRTAHQLFSYIFNSVASEHHYFWLEALASLSLAESTICAHYSGSKTTGKAENCTQLSKVIQHYHQAMTSLTAAVTPNHTLHFQCTYARLRCEMLQAHSQLVHACSLVRTCPPPAISSVTVNLESSSSDSPSTSSSILLTQMKACADWFLSVATGYSELHMTSFDSDPRTLININILQQSCSVMAQAIDVLVLSRSVGQRNVVLQNGGLENLPQSDDDDHYTKAVRKAFASVLLKLQDVLRTDNPAQPISHVQADCLMQCSSILLSVPHSYPRYFYQSLQTTNIKLAISPNQHASNEPVSVEINQQLALKVEGVIQHENTQSQDGAAASSYQDAESAVKEKFRNVAKIKLQMKKTKQGQSKMQNTKEVENDCDLEQIVEPHNDYFSSQFLVSFPVPGIYNINIDTSVKDSDGSWWKTGPQEVILVKSYDDVTRLQQQTNRANHNRH